MPTRGLLSVVQEGITHLLLNYQQPFLGFGLQVFFPLAVFLIALHAIRRWLFSSSAPVDAMGELVALMGRIVFVYSLLIFYDAPIPGIGISFPNLLVDQCTWFAQRLDSQALQTTSDHLDIIFDRFKQPGWTNFAGNLMYVLLLGAVAVVKVLALFSVAGAMIASAVIKLFGPIFILALLIRPLERYFYGWLTSFLVNLFVPVVALGYLMVFEVLLFGFQTTLPAAITEDAYPLYIVNGLVIIVAFGYEMMHVRAMTAAMFSGHGHSGGGSMLNMFFGR